MRADLRFVEPATGIAHCGKRFRPLVNYEALVEHERLTLVQGLQSYYATHALSGLNHADWTYCIAHACNI